ncbi:vesicle-associated membrane protein 7-like isoform X1 [Mya arenaria]|uniref:vesicle-associated membrane protein 7-like isoform X2 n=1 Tax=Mya arenaria TaxID=6604 RepID=UPI0022E97C71|nr:vesicle-associated membrane protein 7-like isoform X2 [Mya arenaria]XP_052818329.1 vesicle-associated membrane protein 7-like isoform X1 [Mya arenaria]
MFKHCTMAINYSCIARGTVILCSHGNQAGSTNYEQFADSVLKQIPTRNNGKTTVNMNGCKFHCIVENGIIFMCAAKPDFKTQPCFAFLTEIKDQFHNQNLSDRAGVADSHTFDSEFNSTLAKNMDKFSKPGAGDKVAVLQGQVKEVQGVMRQNIESVIQRGERLDDLMDKTDELEAGAATFQRTASKIRKKYWWKNTKMKIIVGCVVFVILVGIVLAIVFGGHLVGGGGDDDNKSTPAPPITSTQTMGR